jgi:superfamily I DNA/RNA helicase
MTPTKEQQSILDAFKNTTGNMKVLALAGTGKTHSLMELVKDNPDKTFLYLAFNKSIKEEVESKAKNEGITNLKAQTQNSFCLSLARGAGMTCTNISGYMSVKMIAHRLGLYGNERFMAYHFDSDVMLHDVYVKLVQLHYNQTVPVTEDVVLLDEAQDINPVFSDIVSRMDARVIAVGDSNQAIYQFRGAQDFLSEMPAETVLSLTQSFRFTPEIAEKVNKLLVHMTDLRLEGFGGAGGDGTSAILCRTNIGCLSEALALLGSDTRFSLQGGVNAEGFKMVEDLISLYEGRFQDVQHPDLKGIKSMQDLDQEIQDMLLDAEWKQVLRLIDKMGGFESAQGTIQDLKDSQKKVPADAVVITTGHKSKGSGFDTVRISDDFERMFYRSEVDETTGKRIQIAIPFSEAPRVEKNLFYVACTRVKTGLEVGLCERLFDEIVVTEEMEEAA